jgi:hypothetical protein
VSLRVDVPPDHGATDVIDIGEERVVVRPHDYPEDTYPNIWFLFAVGNEGPPRAQGEVVLTGLPGEPYRPFWRYCVVSPDGRAWRRIPAAWCEAGEDTLVIRRAWARGERLWIAETFPLTYGDNESLIAATDHTPQPGVRITRQEIGRSNEGRAIWALTVEGDGARAVRDLALVAGQHAVEESGKWFAWTAVRGLRDGWPGAATVLRRWRVHVVPLVNPDGCYDGRMNTNAAGAVVGTSAAPCAEMDALTRWALDVRPAVWINAHGWGNQLGVPPHEGWYRWADSDPLYRHVRHALPGVDTSPPGGSHFTAETWPLEAKLRDCGALCGGLEINWNFQLTPDGRGTFQPLLGDLERRSWQYLLAIAEADRCEACAEVVR